MSYRCSVCRAPQPPGTKVRDTVVRMRKREYPPRAGVYPVRLRRGSGHDTTSPDDPGGTGYELAHGSGRPVGPCCAKEDP